MEHLLTGPKVDVFGMKFPSTFSILVLLAILPLAACSLPGSSTPEPTPAAVVPVTPGIPTDAASPEIDLCLVGEWKVVNMSAYMITAMEAAYIQLEYQFSSGQALYVFSTDGVFLIQADQRSENYVMKFDSGGVVVDVPISVSIDGFGSARYSASGGRVEFTNMSSSGLVFETTVFEETQSMDFWAADDPSATAVFLYECVGADTLHLTPPINDYAVFPVVLERNR